MEGADNRHAVRPRKPKHQVVLEAAYAPFARGLENRIAEVERRADLRLLGRILNSKGHIERPVQLAFDPPVRADGMSKAFGIAVQ